MKRIIVEKKFDDLSRRVKAYRLLTLQNAGTIDQFMWDEIEEESKLNGKVLLNKRRYFYDFAGDNTVFLRSGDYKDFLLALKLYELLKKDGGYPKTAERIFNSMNIKALGMLNIIETNDGNLILGIRSKQVQQAQGYLSFTGGGVMPEEQEDPTYPNLYFSARKQIKDELGLDVEEKDLNLSGIVRDDHVSYNASLMFETRVDMGIREILDASGKAKDKYEHKSIKFIPVEELFDRLGDDTLNMSGISRGMLLLRGRRLFGQEWYDARKESMHDYQVVEKD